MNVISKGLWIQWCLGALIALLLLLQLAIHAILTGKHPVLRGSGRDPYEDLIRRVREPKKGKDATEHESAASNNRPNLIFIMTDQQQYSSLSIAGNQMLHTPNMDRIAREGVFFTRAYTQCAVCAPARTSLLTGLSIENTKVRNNNVFDDDDDDDDNDDDENGGGGDHKMKNVTTYDEYLVKEEGYIAEYYGKWHSLPRLNTVYQNEIFRSFAHHYRDYLASVNLTRPRIDQMKNGTQIQSFNHLPYRTNPLDSRYGLPPGSEVSAKGERINEPDQHGVSEISAEHTLTAFEASEFLRALERMASRRNDKRPFSLHLSLNRPHSPITPSEPYASMYQVGDMVPPASMSDPMVDSPYKNANGRDKRKQYADPELIKFMIANCYAFIKEIDIWLGEILDEIDELGLTNNTLLVFTSDHGEMLGAHGMREKNVFYEESVHVPLMIRFPGVIAPGSVVDDPVSHIDLFGTMLDYLGAKPRASDGDNLRTIIERQERAAKVRGTSQSDKSYAVSEWNMGRDEPGLMICTIRWKLFIPNTARSEVANVLYDLKDDPHEMNNLLGNNQSRPLYLKTAEKLKRMLVEWLQKVNSPHLEDVMKREL